MPIFDAHIHIGQFREQYTSPQEVVELLSSVGVGRFAVSSTTTCEGNYAKVIDEMLEMQEVAQNRMSAVLWLLPQAIYDGTIERMKNSGMNWLCLKIHPQLHPSFWKTAEAQDDIANIANEIHLPLLIHTGDCDGCYPEQYEKTISHNPNLQIIFAHGRPIEQTISLMKKYSNVWTDTAFMPLDNIVRLCREGLSTRVLWGTDYPIIKYYYHSEDIKAYYLDLVCQLKHSIDQYDFDSITYQNFEQIFNTKTL